MRKKSFEAQAVLGTSYFDGIEIMIDDSGDTVYHRHFWYSNEEKKTHRIAHSEIKYATPEWSEEAEPYFMRQGRREYISNYVVVGL